LSAITSNELYFKLLTADIRCSDARFNIASGQTTQKTLFLAATTAVDHTEKLPAIDILLLYA
jgi:hypothetical protein